MLYVVQRTAQVKQKNYNCYEETSYKDTAFEKTRIAAYWLENLEMCCVGIVRLDQCSDRWCPSGT